MAIKSREATQFHIKQFILTNDDNPDYWKDDQFDEPIIGYFFSVKEGKSFLAPTRVLNLYFINPKYYVEGVITINELRQSWKNFVSKCITEKNTRKQVIFKNPPLKDWMNTKENWCKKLAKRMSAQFNRSFDDMLSEVYFSVTRLYSRGLAYMGNLNYLQIAIYNFVRMELRYYKKRLVTENGNILSLNDIITADEDGELICLADVVGIEDPFFEKLEITEAIDKAMSLLRINFSEREIEQILTQTAGYLPRNLYKRVLAWRQKHTKGECYE